jgi:hypothetical protein
MEVDGGGIIAWVLGLALFRRKPPRSRVELLRRRLRAHNAQVLLMVGLSLVTSLALWGTAYIAAYWLVLLGLTVAQGPYPQMPRHFNRVLAVVAGVSLLVAWMEKRARQRNERAVDKKPGVEIALEIALLLPRLTLAIPDNLSAWQRLSDDELRQAIAFTDKVRAARRFPVHSAPVEIPDDAARERIIFALLHLRVLEMFQDDGAAWLRFVGGSPVAPVALGSSQ